MSRKLLTARLTVVIWLRGHGLDGVQFIVGDKCLGMLEAVDEVFSVVPRSKVKLVAKMLRAIHARESKKASLEKAKAVVESLKEIKLKEAPKKVEDSVEKTLTYTAFPLELDTHSNKQRNRTAE